MAPVPAALRALLSNLIDYAGLYPPASLPLEVVEERYRGFRASPEAWILNRLVLPFSKLPEAHLDPQSRVTLLVESDPGALPRQVETLESKTVGRFDLPTYFEVPLEQVGDGFAKIRTGGLTPEAIPTAQHLGEFLCAAALQRTPFKATAGLHHPIRGVRALTYATDSPRAPMHGFLNVFAAAVLAWHGMDLAHVIGLIEESDPASLLFTEGHLRWRGHQATVAQVSEARRLFAHSFGSCSFEEPVTELRELGLLP